MSDIRLIDANALKFTKVAEVNGVLTHVLTAEDINNTPTVATERSQDNLIKPLTELCDSYCGNCPVTGGKPNPNDCTDCICTHIRGIIGEVKKNDQR